MSSTPYDIRGLLRTIKAHGDDAARGNDEARRECLSAARSLCFALETPIESILRVEVSEKPHHAAIVTALDLNLFDRLEEKNKCPKHSDELAEMTGADPVLMGRLLRHLAAMGTIYETGVQEYLPTPMSSALTQTAFRDAFPIAFDVAGPAIDTLPKYLSKTGYTNPENGHNSAFQMGYDTKEHFFEWMSNNPIRATQFNSYMSRSRLLQKKWSDSGYHPVEANLIEGAKEGGVFMVDIGGGKGHDLQDLSLKYPHLPGKLILQDQAKVIKEAKSLNSNITAMEHDLFSPQPIKGARAYYISRVLHDWPNATCLEILARLKPAMIKGYSKLLIKDNVLADKGAHWAHTGLDLIMMACVSGTERTEQAWHALLKTAGFKITKIWKGEPVLESLIEAELA